MGHYLLLAVSALTVAAVVFGVTVLVSGSDPGLTPSEPDGQAVPLPGTRPLAESDVSGVRFDTALRGYRMAQVDQAMRRAAYDIGYKDELISVLEAEVAALRDGRLSDAEVLRRAREAAVVPASAGDATAPEDVGAEDDPASEPMVAAAAAAAVPADEGGALPAVDEPELPAGDLAGTSTSGADEASAEPADRATDDEPPAAEPVTAAPPTEPSAAAPASPAEPEPAVEPEPAPSADPEALVEPGAGAEPSGAQQAAEASASGMNTPAERA